MTLADALHGSILAFKELLTHSGTFMEAYYQDTAEMMLKYREHRDPLIRKAVMQLLPNLVQYDKVSYVARYLPETMTWLIQQLRKDRERSAAFLALSKIILVTEQDIMEYVDAITRAIKDTLMTRNKLKATAETTPVLRCVSALALAVGTLYERLAFEILDAIFGVSISASLIQAVIDLANKIPILIGHIQGKILVLM